MANHHHLRAVVLALLLLAAFFPQSALLAPFVHAESVVGRTVVVGNNPDGIAYDASKGELFVANSDEIGTVSVISDTANSVVATVPVGGYPTHVAYDPSRGELYVASAGDGAV